MVIGAVSEPPLLVVALDSVDATTDESVVGNAPGFAVPSAVILGPGAGADEPGAATTEVSSVGKRVAGVPLDGGENSAVATAGFSGFCGNAELVGGVAFLVAAC